MTRFVAVALLLILVAVPATGTQMRADQQEQKASLFSWFQPLRGTLNWLFARIPTFRSTSQNVGGMIDPVGLAVVPDGMGNPRQEPAR